MVVDCLDVDGAGVGFCATSAGFAVVFDDTGGVSGIEYSTFRPFIVDVADTLGSWDGVTGDWGGVGDVTVGVDGSLLDSTFLPGIDTFGVGALAVAADLLLAPAVFFVIVGSQEVSTEGVSATV